MSTPNDAHQEHRTFTARATLVAIGIKVRQIGLLKPIFQKVRIAQKDSQILPGREVGGRPHHHSRRRSRGWWRPISASAPIRDSSRPLGRSGCAEQIGHPGHPGCLHFREREADGGSPGPSFTASTAGDTAIRTIGSGKFWILTSPEGRVGPRRPSPPPAISADNATVGGRQVGYVLATRYEEVVVQQVFSGNESLTKALRPLVEAAESVLELDDAKRRAHHPAD
jgi:hypothetical protein